MYESPVKISYDDINAKMVQAADGQILATIQQLVSVDKDELIRALQYDRGQYEKGYEDGKRDSVRHGEWKTTVSTVLHNNGEQSTYYGCRCTVCKEDADKSFLYCPNCGAKMDGKENEDGT